jgi:Secretion system C-terminal sorting domain
MGIFVNQVSMIDIQGREEFLSAGLNKFKNLSYGIRSFKSNINISGCQFEDIKQRAVLAEGHSNMSNVFSYRGGKDSPFQEYQDIKNCGGTAIQATRINHTISNVNLLNSLNGITVFQLLNGTSSITNCRLYTVKEGINLLNSQPMTQGEVSNNYFFAYHPQGNAVGIKISGSIGTSTSGWNVSNNNIFPVGLRATGIRCTAGGNHLIADNTIDYFYNGNWERHNGIELSGNQDMTVSCNYIKGNNTGPTDIASRPLLGKGINVANNTGLSLSCNKIDKTPIGINFWGNNIGTDFDGNTIEEHQMGLLLGRYLTGGSTSGDVNIGEQEHKGNIWTDLSSISSSNGIGARHLSSLPLQVQFSRFDVDQAQGNSFLPSNENNASANWFFNVADNGTTFSCSTPVACENGVGWQGFTGGDGDAAFADKLNNGGLSSELYTDVFNWTAKRQLYYRTAKGQAVISTNPLLSTFHQANTGTDIGHFNTLKTGISQLFAISENDKTAFLNDLTQLRQIMQQIADLNGLIAQTPQGQQLQEYLSLKAAQLQILTTLQNSLQTKGQAILNQRESARLTMEGNNSLLGAETVYKQNEKTVNQIYLSLIGQENPLLTATQISALLAIAQQCPLEGGDAVFQARSILALVEEEYIFQDEDLCASIGERSNQSFKDKETTCIVQLHPNPAKDRIELSYQLLVEGEAKLVIQNEVGQLIWTESIPNGQGAKQINLENYPAGIYFMSIQQNGGVLHVEKFVVIK